MNLRILKLHFPSPTLHVFVVVYVKPFKALLFYIVNVQLDLLSHLYFLFIFNSGLPSESFSIWGSTFSISSSAHVLVMNNLIFPWKYMYVFSHPHTWRIVFLDMIFLVGSFLSCHTFKPSFTIPWFLLRHYLSVLFLLSWKVIISQLFFGCFEFFSAVFPWRAYVWISFYLSCLVFCAFTLWFLFSFEKLSVIISSDIYLPLSLFSFWQLLITCTLVLLAVFFVS